MCNSLVPRPFPPPVFDCILYASFPGRSRLQFLIAYCIAYRMQSKTGGGNGLGMRLMCNNRWPSGLIPRLEWEASELVPWTSRRQVIGVKLGLHDAVFYAFPYKLHPKPKVHCLVLASFPGSLVSEWILNIVSHIHYSLVNTVSPHCIPNIVYMPNGDGTCHLIPL